MADFEEENQFKELCDSFQFDVEEFKKKPERAGEMARRIEDDAINTGFENQPSNKINQLGLGPKILELKRKGHSLHSIAESFGLPYSQVQKWWETFQALSPKQKNVFAKVMNENSVFNLSYQVEKAFANLTSMADEIKENPELWVTYAAEIRQYIKMAQGLMESVMLQKRREEETQVILEEIRKADPKIALAILKRLQELKQTRGLLGGG